MPLPIKQRLNRLTSLRSGPRTLLIEICEIIENGGHGLCWATNNTLAASLGQPPKSISRLLAGLESNGWLVVKHFPEQGNRREIRASDKVRDLYTCSEKSEDTPPESEDTPLPPKVRIPPTEVGIPTPQSEDRVSPEVRTLDYTQDTIIEKKEMVVVTRKADQSEDTPSEDTTTTSFASLVDKISELQTKLENSQEIARNWAKKKNALITRLKAELAEAKKSPPAPSAAPPPPRPNHKVKYTDSQLNRRPRFTQFLTEIDYADADVGHYMMRILRKTEDLPERSEKQWEDYILKFLDNEKYDKEGDKLVRATKTSQTAATRPGRHRQF